MGLVKRVVLRGVYLRGLVGFLGVKRVVWVNFRGVCGFVGRLPLGVVASQQGAVGAPRGTVLERTLRGWRVASYLTPFVLLNEQE